jgi:hypothetical protein
LSFSVQLYFFSRSNSDESPDPADFAGVLTAAARTAPARGLRSQTPTRKQQLTRAENLLYVQAQNLPGKLVVVPNVAPRDKMGNHRGRVGLPFEDAVMRSWRNLGGMMGLAALVVTAAGGCTISIQPWTKPIALGQTPEPPLGSPGYKGPLPNPYPPNYPVPTPNGYPPNGYPANGYPPNGYPPAAYPPSAYAPNTSAGNESVALLMRQLNDAEDQRKALVDQVQSLKKVSRERDENLQHASYEMEESSKQLKKTREEVRQFAGEMDDLRERMKKLEDMRTALKPLIDEIMFHLEREKEGPKLPRAAAQAK